MSKIISVHPLPRGDLYVTEVPFYNRIRPECLDEFFSLPTMHHDNFVDLLLDGESIAVYHLDPDNVRYLGNPQTDPYATPYVQPLLLCANYHNGHSEGDHKIIIQNIPDKKGPWVLYRPPGSHNSTFHFHDVVFPDQLEPKFEEEVANPLKILYRYLHKGDPLEIFEQFREAGFDFVD